jgi:hypothetical protein
MEVVNAPLRRLVDLLLSPFQALPWWVGLAVVTFLVTLVAMPIIKWTLNPRWADAAKRRMTAAVFELRLFNDDLRATFRALFDMLRWTGLYLGAWLLPLVVMGVLMLPVFAQLQAHYGWKGLEPGEQTTLRAHFSTDRDTKPVATLRADDGVEVETPALWIPSRRELVWRLRAAAPGAHQLTLDLEGESTTKHLAVAGDAVARRSPVRGKSFSTQLLYPAEPPLPKGSPLAEIALDYDDARSFLLVPVWCWVLVLLSIPFALLLKKPFGVEF